ncbi:MAG TPA: AAA family ATPase [Anaerolineae bacterium]|nr:AAA family ATPase [Anaerolineae bacterium]
MAQPIDVHLAAPTMDRVTQFLMPPIMGDARMHIIGIASVWNDLRERYMSEHGDVLLVQADIASNPQALLTWLQKLPTPAVVVLPNDWAHEEGKFRSIRTVHEVFVGDNVNFAEVARRVHDVGLNARERRNFAEPDRAILAGGPRGATVVGTRIIAVWGKGGSGKSTLTSNLAYELARRGLRTIAIGLDVPDALAVYLDVKITTTSMAFFQRPGLDGLRASIIRKDSLDVVLSPNGALLAEEIASRPIEDPGSIRSLVMTAASDNYAAVLLDLPAERTEWAIQPLIAANTVLLVAQPSFVDLQRVVELYRILTGTLAGRHRVATDAIHLVMNEVSNDDNLLSRDFTRAAQDVLGRPFPPVIGGLPLARQVRTEQNSGQLPSMRLDDFGKAIRVLADTLFPGTSLGRNGNGRYAQERGGFLKKALEFTGFNG